MCRSHLGTDETPINTQEAIRFYTLATEGNHTEAMNQLGMLYMTGHDGRIEPNHTLTLKWVLTSAKHEDPEGQFLSALCLQDAIGKRDPSKAHQLLIRA